jgi:hypothetical protein
LYEIEVETVSLVLLAILKIKPSIYLKQAKLCFDFLMGKMKDGQFGGGQCTILALKAMVEYTIKYKTEKSQASFNIKINSKKKTIDLTQEFEDFQNSK